MNSTVSTLENVLYFPHIEIRDATFLKSALCIWEAVYRIVPESVKPEDSDEIKEAVDNGLLRNIQLSQADLERASTEFHDFLESVPIVPDALSKQPFGTSRIHYEKFDQQMVRELSDLVGVVKRSGDWFELPRGLAEGYMLFLSNAVARRRAMPKITDSETMFVGMGYFANDGNMNEFVVPTEPDEDVSISLLLRTLVPQGLEDAPMSQVLKFRNANPEGRRAFREAVNEMSQQLSRVEEQKFALELIDGFKKKLEDSQEITLAKVREFFSGAEPILLYLGLPVLAKAFDLTASNSDSIVVMGALGIATIAALADAARSRRKEWVPTEATYLAKLRQQFSETSPIPKRIRRLDRIMEEFMND